VRLGCNRVAPPPRTFRSGSGLPILVDMEPLASVSFSTTGGPRAAGWQQQLRVDYVVNKVMQTHRGKSEDVIKQAIQDQLRSFGVVPNGRQVSQYAAVISQLPLLPPANA
jgi:hypothetical protein